MSFCLRSSSSRCSRRARPCYTFILCAISWITKPFSQLCSLTSNALIQPEREGPALFMAYSSASQHGKNHRNSKKKKKKSLLYWNHKTFPSAFSFDWSLTACRRIPQGQFKLTETWTIRGRARFRWKLRAVTIERRFMWQGPKCLISGINTVFQCHPLILMNKVHGRPGCRNK